MTVRRAARVASISLRMSRTELVLASIVAIVLGVGVVVGIALLKGVEVPAGCFLTGDSGCTSGLLRFHEVEGAFVWTRGVAAGLFAPLIGLILGVPIVARELESRTASLAWSLTGSRSAWLLHRTLPIVAVAAIGLASLSVLEVVFHGAVAAGRPGNVDDLGGYGITFVARGALALGVGMLAGAILGRAYLALLAAIALSLVLVTVGVWSLRAVAAEAMAEWREMPYGGAEEEFGFSGPVLYLFESGYRLSDGRLLDEAAFWDDDGLYERVRETRDRPDEWLSRNVVRLERVVPVGRLRDFELLEASVAFGIGAGAFLLTFPVVIRKRPPE